MALSSEFLTGAEKLPISYKCLRYDLTNRCSSHRIARQGPSRYEPILIYSNTRVVASHLPVLGQLLVE